MTSTGRELIISIHSFLLLPANMLPWWLGFRASAEQEAVMVKTPPVCYWTLLVKINTFYYKALQCEMSHISFALKFSGQNMLYLAKVHPSSGALRGYCCTAIATKFHSLFQVFTKCQDICYKWFAMMVLIFIFWRWSVCNLMRKSDPLTIWMEILVILT